MAFDIFSQPQGPNIDVNLFANNALAGVKVGQALGTPLSNAIEGVTKGILTGQQIAQNAANIELTQANAAKAQADVENIPIENEIRRQQLENQKAVNDINKLKIQVEQATLADKLEADRLKLEEDRAVLTQKRDDRNTSTEIGKVLSGSDEAAKLGLLQNPAVDSYLRRNPDENKLVLGQLLNTDYAKANPEFRQDVLNRLDAMKAFEWEKQKQDNQAKADQKVLDEYDKTFDTARKDPGIGDIVENTPLADLPNLRVLDTGIYETDPKTGNLTGKVLTPDLSRPASYGVFDKSGKVMRGGLTGEQGSKLKAAQIAEYKKQTAERQRMGLPPLEAPFNKPPELTPNTPAGKAPVGGGNGYIDMAGDVVSGVAQDFYKGAGVISGYLTGDGTPTPSSGNTTRQPQAQTPASKVQFARNEEGRLTLASSKNPQATIQSSPTRVGRNMGDIVSAGADQIATPGTQQEAVDTTRQVATIGRDAGASAGIIQRAVTAVVPSFMQSNVVDEAATPPSLDERSSVSEIRNVVDNYSERAAGYSVKALASGTQEEKDAVRSFAKANDIPLSYKGFKNYYAEAANSNLSDVYNEAYNYGTENSAQVTRANNAAGAIRERAAEQRPQVETQSQTVRGATESAPPGEISAPSEPITLTQAAQNVAVQAGMTPKQTRDTITVVNRVDSVPELADKPAYVKALAAVESAGKANAKSSTGVKGYMQVTKRVAGHYGLNRDIPEENALAGQFFIEDLIQQFKGNRQLAYAAYNTGPAVVKYAQKLAGSDDWKEVKKFLPQALQKYERAIGVPWEQKIKEVTNYPERVGLYEAIYNGRQSDSV